PLSEDEMQVLRGLPLTVVPVDADQDIVREGDRPSQSCILLEGFVCRYKLTEDGRRQIFSFHTPGDIPDLQSLHLAVMDHNVKTLTRCKVAFVPHEALSELTRRCPRVGDVLWRDTLIDAAIFREWMVGIGRRSAVTRIAHMLCEVFLRLKAIGLADGYECEFPITQTEIGDALGLSTVHVNRSLQELRSAGLIELRRGALGILDWPALCKAGEFDSVYLHLDSKAQDAV
ncbi:MAG TPA: Crp/Fnr family transcriptional regulator, partial [Beijerinckiaceae bacterium]|nr:Crp/Fnr family transcriptional regulator [Beijerinckiaceae bacterium]